MKNNLLLILILLPASFAFGQDKAFDLSKYKLPDIKRHQLDFSFSSDGNTTKYKQEQSDPQSGDLNYNRITSNSESSITYKYFHNTRSRILEISSSFSPSLDYIKTENENQKSVTNKPEFNFHTWGTASFYKSGSSLFLQINAYLYNNFDRSESKIDGQTNSKSISNYLHSYVGLGVGKGRMEPVSDLWQSYIILEKLNDQHSLTRDLKDEDFFEFATLVSQLKNKRIFDYRQRKIIELTALDSLLHKQNLVEKTDISYFTTVNDYWSFANIENRESGSVLKFQIAPYFDSSSNEYLYEPRSKSHSLGINPSINYSYYKPVNLFWDRMIWFSAYETLIFEQKNSDYSRGQFSFNLGAGYRYLPNFRTTVYSGLSYSGSENSRSEDNVTSKYWNNSANFSFEIKYYISPQVQISGKIHSSYSIGHNNNRQNYFVTFYNLGLNYAIF